MAKIVVVGDNLVITSARKVEEIELLKKYDSKALRLYETNEETGKKDEVFRICMSAGDGSVSNCGICFAGPTHDKNGYATVSMKIPADVTDIKGYVADTVGVAVTRLKQVEGQFDDALAKIRANRDEVLNTIQIM